MSSAPSAPIALDSFETHPGVANGAIDRLCVHYSTVAHTPKTAESFVRAIRRMHYAYGRNYFLLMVNDVRQSGLLSEETRAIFAKILREQELHPLATALLILSPSFLGVTTRSIITGLLLATRPSSPCQVFSATPAAVTWLQQHAQKQRIAMPALPQAEAALAEAKKSAHDLLAKTP